MYKDLEVDNKVLIRSVEANPVLWDKTLDTYRDRTETKNAWDAVCTETNPSFLELGKQEKYAFSKAVMKRWANIRDGFKRCEKKQRDSIRFPCSGQKPCKTYTYGQELQFLKKNMDGHGDDSFCDMADLIKLNPQITDNVSDDEELNTINEQIHNSVCTYEVVTSKRPVQHTKKKRKPSSLEIEMISEKQTPDRHISFFNAIVPSLETFDDDEVVEFQLKVLQVISEIKKNRNKTQ